MSTFARRTTTISGAENAKVPLKSKTGATKLGQRAALGEIGNTVPAKVQAGKKETFKTKFLKPVTKVVAPKPASKDALQTKVEEPKPKIKKEPLKDIVKVTSSNSKSLNLKKDWLKSSDIVIEKAASSHVPPGVQDIDKIGPNDLFLLSTYVVDIYDYLKSLEDKYAIRYKHLSHLPITGHMRSKLVDWLVDIQVQFQLIPESLQITISILDRYLQAVDDVTLTNLQLVGIACLFIACKYEETYPPDLDDYVYMSGSTYLGPEILEMECKILKVLDFNLGKPVPITFLRRYSRATTAEPSQHSFAKYFIELALLDYKLSCEKPSIIAAASLYIAQRIAFQDDDMAVNGIWNPTITYYSGYTLNDFEHIIPRLAFCIKQASVSKLNAIYHKYSHNKFHKVSLLPQVQSNSKILEGLIETTSF